VGPIILKLLPPNIDPNNPAQTAVIMPCVGVAPEAMAKAIDKGILTKLTVNPDFQLDKILLSIKKMFIL